MWSFLLQYKKEVLHGTYPVSYTHLDVYKRQTEDNYEGTYLMFDTEAIDNVERYETIKENRDMFTTLYGEKSVADKKHPKTAFSDSWQHYGFQIDSDRI